MAERFNEEIRLGGISQPEEETGYSIEIVVAISDILQQAQWATPEKREDYAQQVERLAKTIRLMSNEDDK